MLIQTAHAEDAAPPAVPVDAPLTSTDTTTSATTAAPNMPDAPSTMQMITTNMGMVLVLVVLFYLLLVKPQQKRFRDHSAMLSDLKKGDRVVTGGGLLGTVEKLGEADEAVIDLGNNVKITVLRSSILGKDDPAARKKAADAQKK